ILVEELQTSWFEQVFSGSLGSAPYIPVYEREIRRCARDDRFKSGLQQHWFCSKKKGTAVKLCLLKSRKIVNQLLLLSQYFLFLFPLSAELEDYVVIFERGGVAGHGFGGD